MLPSQEESPSGRHESKPLSIRAQIEVLRRRSSWGDKSAPHELEQLLERYVRIVVRRASRVRVKRHWMNTIAFSNDSRSGALCEETSNPDDSMSVRNICHNLCHALLAHPFVRPRHQVDETIQDIFATVLQPRR